MASRNQIHTNSCYSLFRYFSGALLLWAVASMLTACGGGPESAASGGGSGCITGPTPTVLTWDAVTGAAGYNVYVRTASGTYSSPQDAGPNTTYPVPGLSSGTTYYFVTTAYDGSNESVFSNEVCKTIS